MNWDTSYTHSWGSIAILGVVNDRNGKKAPWKKAEAMEIQLPASEIPHTPILSFSSIVPMIRDLPI